MATEVYRKKSLERISAPEDLNDYLHVTRPPVWIFLVAVIVLIVGSLLWARYACDDRFRRDFDRQYRNR